jgi:cytochrome c biogenesis protein CcmG, thiol:disulfide interchange protein DsbE
MKASLAAVLAVGLLAAACGGPAAQTGGGATTGGSKDAAKGGLVGSPGPEVAGESLNGQGKFSLSGSKGKVVLVDFWATWCEPCKKSFPKLEELNVKYKGAVVIVGISEDDEKKDIADFGKTHGAKFPLLWDDGKGFAKKYPVDNMPTSFILDKNGVVKFMHQGYHDGEELEIEKEIKSLL